MHLLNKESDQICLVFFYNKKLFKIKEVYV